MDFDPGPSQQTWAAKVAKFASTEIAPGADERDRNKRFSRRLWKRMGEIGLLGLLIPPEYGGVGVDFLTTAVAFENMARYGHDMGVCVSLTVTTLLCHFQLLRHANENQKKKYLPAVVSGEKVPAFAVSERDRGAHPRYLQTTAERDDSGYTINGRKMYITNGPVADFVIVFAVTEKFGDRNGISAFLVDRGTPGFSVGEIMDLDFCRSSPHSELVFENCHVPAENLIGEKNNAFDRMVRGVRETEDALGMPTFAGFLNWQLECAAACFARRAQTLSDEQATLLAGLASITDAARIAALRVAWLRDMKREETSEFAACHSHFQTLVDSAIEILNGLTDSDETLKGSLERPLRDMKIALIGRNVSRIRRRKLAARLVQEMQ